MRVSLSYRSLFLCVCLYLSGSLALSSAKQRRFVDGRWTLQVRGTSGVSAMQMAVMTEYTAIMIDKVEHNPMQVNGHMAWASEYNFVTNVARPLNPISNTWCAAGSFLGNGTFISTGGNPPINNASLNGVQSIRFFNPCIDETCDLIEEPDQIHLTSNRWYPSSVRLQDGSVMIYGGSLWAGYINSPPNNNPTYEFYPPKNINGYNGVKIPTDFLDSYTLNANHFPIIIVLPQGDLFIVANQKAVIFSWKNNTVIRNLPDIPNNVRVTSPMSAGAVLLPLTKENNYTPEVLICGGSDAPDDIVPKTVSSQRPTSDQCIRMVLTDEGMNAGWKVEHMPEGRVMTDLILLPDRRILIVNGAHTGVAGYGNVPDMIGYSNADHPAYQAIVYDPSAPEGSRFSTEGIDSSNIARVYHSSATLTPEGTIMLAGSNPNPDVRLDVPYPTEYRVEFMSPPYMTQPRPIYYNIPDHVHYGETYELGVQLPENTESVTVVLIDPGFSTHAVHMDQRLVELESSLNSARDTVTFKGPSVPTIYPPGPGYIYVVTGAGVPSHGYKTMVGTGQSPPVDQGAIENLRKVGVDHIPIVYPPEGEGSLNVTHINT